jgi:hypothetical protein
MTVVDVVNQLNAYEARVEALERHIIITRDVIHALNGHSGDRETCEVGPCGPANEALAAADDGPTDAQQASSLAGAGYHRDIERTKSQQDERNPE